MGCYFQSRVSNKVQIYVLLSCELLSSQHDGEQHVGGKTTCSTVDYKEDRRRHQLCAGCSEVTQSSISHRPSPSQWLKQSSGVGVCADMKTKRDLAFARFLHTCKERSPSRGEIEDGSCCCFSWGLMQTLFFFFYLKCFPLSYFHFLLYFLNLCQSFVIFLLAALYFVIRGGQDWNV